jgi:hypothetical protein
MMTCSPDQEHVRERAASLRPSNMETTQRMLVGRYMRDIQHTVKVTGLSRAVRLGR